MSDVAFRAGQAFSQGFLALFSTWHIDGLDHVPKKGAYLMVANHISHFDPNYLAMRLPTTMDYLADVELLRIPVLGSVLKSWNAFAMDRGKNDTAAIRECVQRLKNGRPVGIFPERGLRYREESVLNGAELAPGTASLAKMANVPILPAAIIGSDQVYQWRSLYRRPPVYVRYGPLLPAPQKSASRESISTAMADEIRKLAKSIQQDFQIGEPILPPRTAQERWREG